MKLCVLIFVCFGVGYCGSNKTIPNYNLKNTTLPSIEYYTTYKPTIRIMIHIDNVLTKKLSAKYGPKTRRKLKIRTQTLVKEVENFFRHPTLKQRIRLVLLDTKFLKNNSNVVTMSENATEYLKSYCDWQGVKKMDKQRHYSVLLTGLDIYVQGGKEGRTSTGRGYMGGICSVKKSCALLEWNARNIGYLLAHEIAHSLGVPHDGPPYNQCRRAGQIMSATYNPMHHPKNWSPCSRRRIKWYLNSRKAWCLRPVFNT